MSLNLQAFEANLQMASCIIRRAEAKKYFLNFELICVAGTEFKIEVQGADSFNIAAIDSTYLNNHVKLTN